MDGTTAILTSTGLNIVALGVVVFAVKKTVTSCIENLEKRLEAERDTRVRVDNELWAAVNKHGHKGLSGNDARVTR